MDVLNAASTPHHHPCGDWAVKTAAEAKHDTTAGSDWQTVRSFLTVCVEDEFVGEDFNVHCNCGVLKIDGDVQVVMDDSADFACDDGTLFFESLVNAGDFDFE